MTLFDLSESERKARKAEYTIEEIVQQARMWEKTYAIVESQAQALSAYLDEALEGGQTDIILTGAGTSEFVGNSLVHELNLNSGLSVRSVPTTDLVPAPERYLDKDRKTLLISFARSGNSPESVGSVQLAEAVLKDCYHLFITCNSEGALAKGTEDLKKAYSLVLDPATNDRGFAMTSSFTSMILACLLSLNLKRLPEMKGRVERLSAMAERYLKEGNKAIIDLVAAFPFDRIVYLGALGLKGYAQESALKMLELTAGKVATLHNTPLGFRHGPKSFVDKSALTVLYMSDDAYQRLYAMDLLKEMSPQRQGNKLVVLCNTPCEEAKGLSDHYICFGGEAMPPVELGLLYVLFAQSLAVLRSLDLGLTPDNPFPSGEVNRVVQGVTLYPYTAEK